MWTMKTSNKFTLVRILAAPVFFVLYFLPQWLKAENGTLIPILCACISIVLLAFAEFTDYLDGHFARKHNEVSDFGKMFDPFADVFLHLSSFVCFTYAGLCPLPVLLLIIYREFSQNFLRMVAAKSGTAIAARKGGKFKTVMYVVAEFFSLIITSLRWTALDSAWGLNMEIFRLIGIALYVVCAVLAYVSFIDYLKNFGHVLKEQA